MSENFLLTSSSMNEKFCNTVDNALNKHRKYKHTTEKNIETNRKKKSVKRSTLYKSTPKVEVDSEALRKIGLVSVYALEEASKSDSRGPYLDNVINAASDLMNEFCFH